MRSPSVWPALLMVLIATPMVLRKVPTNRFYGFRTQKTMASETVWCGRL